MADGDTTLGNFFFESPLAWVITLRGLARCSLGQSGWRDDLQAGLAMAREAQGMTQAAVTTYGYGVAVMNGALVPDRRHWGTQPMHCGPLNDPAMTFRWRGRESLTASCWFVSMAGTPPLALICW